jgi:2-oxoglutarate dehydrogenase E1 component
MSRMQELFNTSYLSGNSMEYIVSLFEDYIVDPNSVSDDWRVFFNQIKSANDDTISYREIENYFKNISRQNNTQPNDVLPNAKQAQVMDFVYAYRAYGHLMANVNPLSVTAPEQLPCLTLAYHGLSETDSDLYYVNDSLSKKTVSLPELESILKKTYCGSIGLEYMDMMDDIQKKWWQQKFEAKQGRMVFSDHMKKKILKDLIAADGFERYLHTRFVGQKRFSLQGGDSLIPMLSYMTWRAPDFSVDEVLIGMAHRGRLNVLVNILGKSPQSLYDVFEGRDQNDKTGDVKYHLGFSSRLSLEDNKSVHAFLAFNPSHLEIIGPVVEGAARSRLTIRGDLGSKDGVLPVVIHGDSAFIGQGVVQETFNFSQARGFCTGGTVHIVINNQVGFTTSNPEDTRSSNYCTDIAKMVQAPVIHVNGDDPEAVVFATELAMDYRNAFNRDVVIDLVCYRRLGHNEADEPSLTQPMMYKIIRSHPVLRDMYAKQLQNQQIIDEKWYEEQVQVYLDKMDKGDPVIDLLPKQALSKYGIDWKKYVGMDWQQTIKTGVSYQILLDYIEKLSVVPQGFVLHPVVERTRQERLTMVKDAQPLNWGCAEILAYASILQNGYEVRISGEDCGRGTFAHRHAVWHSQSDGQEYTPLAQFSVSPSRPFEVIDSVLSEEAVLAFEYGYAATNPEALVIWEAQFGDFVNGAQVVIDQFISSGEQKWGRLCGLVMFLPHGYEGQGPEHSSARLERFMQLCAQQNMQVCVPSTPAQIFHLLRRQMLRTYRKPLIVMTPKSLLRHKRAVSNIDELVNGQFMNILPEFANIPPQKVKKLVLCSGKVYYDLLQAREDKNIHDVVLIRIEQLYPFPEEELRQILKTYINAKEIIWCQEEPQNQGAWFTSQHHMQACLQASQTLRYAGREFAAAPAVGSYALHNKQQQAFIEDVFSN